MIVVTLLGASAFRIAIGLNVVGNLFANVVRASSEHALIFGVVLQIGTIEAGNVMMRVVFIRIEFNRINCVVCFLFRC